MVACAKHCGLKNHQIQSAFDTFKGIKRRMEVRGIADGRDRGGRFRPPSYGHARNLERAARQVSTLVNLTCPPGARSHGGADREGLGWGKPLAYLRVYSIVKERGRAAQPG